jgi:magnesium transporter
MTSPAPPDPATRVAADDLRGAWPVLDQEDRVEGFRYLTSSEADSFFTSLEAFDQAQLVRGLPPAEQRLWLRALAPDDAADLVQQAPPEERAGLLGQLDAVTRKEVQALMAYEEDEAGGLMNPRYARLRPEWTVDEALAYLRRQRREHVESVYYAYVLDHEGRLLGAISFRELFAARGDAKVGEVMRTELVTVREELDQEELSHLFAEADLLAIPVVDAEGRMRGIVTADDIVDVVREEATEDIQKIGGSDPLDAPYLQTALPRMIKKRAGWLAVLFVGGMLTVTAMAAFADQLSGVRVLAFFVPLIISTGGNCGSQASTLVIRAMALGELRLRDWWRVLGREAASGLALGVFLGLLGLVRVVFGHFALGEEPGQGAEVVRVAGTVVLAVTGVALWGTLVGALLPFGLRRFGFDPASASAPLVSTMVDVTGIVLYFGLASLLLG